MNGETTAQETTAAVVPAPQNVIVQQPAPREFSRVTMEHLLQLPDDEHRRNWINTMMEVDMARQSYAQDRALAKDFALSGKFDDIKGSSQEQSVATAMVKIQLGRSWGFGASDSIRYVYFINGKPAVEQEIVASKLRQAGWDWDSEFTYEDVEEKDKTGKKSVWKKCTGCTLWLKRWDYSERQYKPLLDRKGNEVSVSFTQADAEHAKVYSAGKVIPLIEKETYQSWGESMFYWRCISKVRRFYANDVLRGAVIREQALEVMPGDAPPEQLPPPPASEPAPAAEPQAQTLRDRIINQASFLEPGDPGGE